MARKYTTGFHHFIHFSPEEDLGAKIEIVIDEFINVKDMKNFLQDKENELGRLLSLQEAVDTIYDLLRDYYSVVAVKGTVEYYEEEYTYEID